MTRKVTRFEPARPPAQDHLPVFPALPDVEQWLGHYWRKLKLPPDQLRYLAVTTDRKEFAVWTGRRLNPMALGCYCFLPLPPAASEPSSEHGSEHGAVRNLLEGASDAHEDAHEPALSVLLPESSMQLALPGFAPARPDSLAGAAPNHHGATDHDPVTDFRHLIFIEPDLLPLSLEVTVAHELIHLADRVRGAPRKHHCHGHDAISVDEAAITGRDPELLRELLRTETGRREERLRRLRPHRYLYKCPHCRREYRRVKQYSRAVSCGNCDRHYNPLYLLQLHALLDKAGDIERLVSDGDDALN